MDIRATEIMVTAGAHELQDGEIVVVGIGLPQVACFLAKSTHAPAASRTISIANTCANHAAPCRSSITQYRLSLHSEASSSASASRLAKLKRTGWISE